MNPGKKPIRKNRGRGGQVSPRLPHPAEPEAGFTLVEMMISMAIISILVASVTPILITARNGFSSFEARSSLKDASQTAVNGILHELTQCKKIFQDTPADRNFLARLPAGLPASLGGSKMPFIDENGTLSVMSPDFSTSTVGNCLFFASLEAPKDLNVSAGGGSTSTVRIDIYHFNYYYLSPDSSKRLGGQARIILNEYHSSPYADYQQLMAISNSAKRNNVATALFNGGVNFAWDPSTPTVEAAFFSLSAGALLSTAPTHRLSIKKSGPVINILTGITGGSYVYGVSPNTGGNYVIGKPVPQFCAANGLFPSGFEILITGPNSARQVFIRLVLSSQGSFKGYIAQDQVILASVRDLY